MSKVIGIDLGTTNSCVAIMEGNEPVVIPNSEGSRTTPSIVAITEDGERLVGQIAKRQAVTNPENTMVSVKRLMGREFDSEAVQEFKKHSAFKIVAAPNGGVRIRVLGNEYNPQEISAMILTNMRQIAEAYLGEQIREAVITVPAYFNESQKRATKDAGRIAGLEVLRVIHEPTAAALSYGLEKSESKKIAVYDLGGGTFDISILEIGDGIYEVLATNGDTNLGGDDFDLVIIEWLSEEFEKNEGINLKNDRLALQRLKEASEKAKCELSSLEETEINLPFITADESGPKHLQATLTRNQLERMVRSLIERTIEPCKEALSDAGLTAKDVDDVILVGGQTRMPMVQAQVSEFFDQEPTKEINPDEVVAIGAAIQGSILKGEVKDILLLDVTPLSLGVETLGGIFNRIIDKNTTIPVKRSKIFTTAEDNQAVVAIHVLQGERDLAAHNKSLGRFELIGIPPAPRGVPQIEVTFSIDANGILEVTAMDLATKKKQEITLVASSGLTDSEIEEMRKDAESHIQQDKDVKAVIEARNRAQTLIYTTQKVMHQLGDKLDNSVREEIENQIEKTERSMELRQLEDIVDHVRELRKLANKISVQALRVTTVTEELQEEAADSDDMVIDDMDEELEAEESEREV